MLRGTDETILGRALYRSLCYKLLNQLLTRLYPTYVNRIKILFSSDICYLYGASIMQKNRNVITITSARDTRMSF